MGESENPLLPAGYDIAWTVISVLMIALLVVALVSIARSATRLTVASSLVWTLVAIFVPLVGPLAWLAVGRRSGGNRADSESSEPPI